MGSNTSLYPLCAWSPSGERARCSVPRNRGKNTTLMASVIIEGMGPSLAIEGSTDALAFETYIEQCLVPTLRAGQVVVMDNLTMLTRANAYANSSKGLAASFCTCRPTHRT